MAGKATINGQPVWYCACFSIAQPGVALTVSYGRKVRSEEQARTSALRLQRAFAVARMDASWAVGIGRTFNRDARPAAIVWARAMEREIPSLPPVKP